MMNYKELSNPIIVRKQKDSKHNGILTIGG